MHGVEAGASGLGLGLGAAEDSPDPCPGSHTRHRRGIQPLWHPTPCDSSSQKLRGWAPGCPGYPQTERQEQVPSGKTSAFPRELPEREKVLVVWAGVKGAGAGWGSRRSGSWEATRVPEGSLGVSGHWGL